MSKTITTTTQSSIKSKLNLGVPTLERLLPSLESGDFAVLSGPSVSYMASLLSVKAQLPSQFGGLGSKVVYVDGGNSFRFYQISRIAQLHGLSPVQVLKQISIARAFTAYQMASLIIDKLSSAVEAAEAKFAIVSDIADLFLADEVADGEATTIYNHSVAYLSRLAKEKQLIILTTYLPHDNTSRNSVLQALTYANTNIAASIQTHERHRYFVLEKHPSDVLGWAEFPSAYPTLLEYFRGDVSG